MTFRVIRGDKERERLKVNFIQKHGRGLNRVPVRTCIIARLKHTIIDYRDREREKEKKS